MVKKEKIHFISIYLFVHLKCSLFFIVLFFFLSFIIFISVCLEGGEKKLPISGPWRNGSIRDFIKNYEAKMPEPGKCPLKKHRSHFIRPRLLIRTSFLLLSSLSSLSLTSSSSSFSYYHFTLCEFFLIVLTDGFFHGRLSDSKSTQVSRTLLSILDDFYSAVVWMVSILIWSPLGTIPGAPTIFSINFTVFF